MIKVGSTVKVPKFHIDTGIVTSVYPIEGYIGVTGKTCGGFTEYRNMAFPSEEVMPV